MCWGSPNRCGPTDSLQSAPLCGLGELSWVFVGGRVVWPGCSIVVSALVRCRVTWTCVVLSSVEYTTVPSGYDSPSLLNVRDQCNAHGHAERR